MTQGISTKVRGTIGVGFLEGPEIKSVMGQRGQARVWPLPRNRSINTYVGRTEIGDLNPLNKEKGDGFLLAPGVQCKEKNTTAVEQKREGDRKRD